MPFFSLKSIAYTKLQTTISYLKTKCQCKINCDALCTSFAANIDCDNTNCTAKKCENRLIPIKNEFFKIINCQQRGFGLFTNQTIIE